MTELARLGRTTVRSLQWYDRLGLLRADRDDAGRRRYRDEHLAALTQIQLLTAAGFTLEQVQRVMDGRSGLSAAESFAAQVRLLELQGLRLRCQQAVLAAVASVLADHPDARVPSRLLTDLIDLDATLLQYPAPRGQDREPGFAELSEEAVARVLTAYFAWKATAAHALLLLENEIPADSASGRRLGRDHRALAGVLGEDDPHLRELAAASEANHASWPPADRELYVATKEYLDRCVTAYLSTAADGP